MIPLLPPRRAAAPGAWHLDYETRSRADLRKVGVWRYAEDPSTEIICAAYARADGEVALWRPGDAPPPFGADEIHAWNAEFEYAIWLRVACRRYGWPAPDLRRFRCTMSLALSFGLPGSLDKAGRVLGLTDRKDPRGERLIHKLCKPRRPSASNPNEFWTPATAPQDFADFYEYCRQDVRTERAMRAALPRPNLPDVEQATYYESVRSSERGIVVHMPDVEAIIAGSERHIERLRTEFVELTGGIKDSQLGPLRGWCLSRGVDLPNVQAETVRDTLDEDLPDDVRRVLEIRQSVGQTSIKKLHAMQRAACCDGRIRGMVQYHGAATGRWAGRLVQLQNLKKLDGAIGRIKLHEWADLDGAFDPDVLELFGDPMSFFTAFVRPCLVASPKKALIQADFSAIECRVLAWLAGETWLLDTFAAGGDVYIVQASDLYGRPITKDDTKEREVGKRIVLGCGYQMGAEKFRATSKKYGAPCTLEFAEDAVGSYRRLNQRIVQFWYDLQDAALAAVENRGQEFRVRHIGFRATARFLQMKLPSGRLLTYWSPRITEGKFGPQVEYSGLNSLTKQWGPQYAYGGRWCENACQAVARDLCRDALLRVTEYGYDYLFSAHDELVCEVDAINADVDSYCRLMAEVPAWAAGCPVAAEGWTGQRYRK